jgi:FAD/FMN-containing dehydrogenase
VREGPNRCQDNGTPVPDAGFSMTGAMLLLCYAEWDDPQHDTANAAWHASLMARLDPFATGHYVGEADLTRPSRAERSYSAASWARLRAVRERYDPDGVFDGYP